MTIEVKARCSLPRLPQLPSPPLLLLLVELRQPPGHGTRSGRWAAIRTHRLLSVALDGLIDSHRAPPTGCSLPSLP